MINTLFFGSSAYSTIIFDSLAHLSDIKIIGVVTKPNMPVGRLQTITPNPVAQFASSHSLPLFQPSDFDPNFLKTYTNLKPDLVLVVAYGPPYFTQDMIDLPKYKVVNIHPSPLPKYRGATPGPWQIINGETKSAVTFFQIDSKPDHGPVIAQIPFDIDPSWTSHDFYQHAFTLASQNLQEILQSYIQNPISLTKQDHSQKSYFPKFTKQTAKIDWSWPVEKVDRFIKAMNPWPIAWTQVQNNSSQKTCILKIFSAHIQAGQLIPDQVQLESKSKTDWSQISPHYTITKTRSYSN